MSTFHPRKTFDDAVSGIKTFDDELRRLIPLLETKHRQCRSLHQEQAIHNGHPLPGHQIVGFVNLLALIPANAIWLLQFIGMHGFWNGGIDRGQVGGTIFDAAGSPRANTLT